MHRRTLEILLTLFLLRHALAKPTLRQYRYSVPDDVDTDTVESLRREVRRSTSTIADTTDGNSPKKDSIKRMKNASGKSDEGGYYKTYGSDAEGEKGYLKETYSNGDHGYKTLDTFHKQDGDKYEFEKHIAYGKSGLHSNKDKDHEGAGTIVDEHYVDNGGDHGAGSESSRYIGLIDGEPYSGVDHGGHYTAEVPDSGSYSHERGGEGRSENYSTGGRDEGTYDSHDSYAFGGNAPSDYGSDRY